MTKSEMCNKETLQQSNENENEENNLFKDFTSRDNTWSGRSVQILESDQ